MLCCCFFCNTETMLITIFFLNTDNRFIRYHMSVPWTLIIKHNHCLLQGQSSRTPLKIFLLQTDNLFSTVPSLWNTLTTFLMNPETIKIILMHSINHSLFCLVNTYNLSLTNRPWFFLHSDNLIFFSLQVNTEHLSSWIEHTADSWF